MKRILLIILLAALPVCGQIVPDQFILELETPLTASGAPARVRAEQARLRSALARERVEILDQFDTVLNAIVVRSGDPSRLAGLPGVIAVYPVRLFKPLLDRIAIIHSLNKAWARFDAGKAGAGMKIGILDSGIDIGHPAFQDETLRTPEGFPKVNREEDKAWTNSKVIVARSYGGTEAKPVTPQDLDGHGTAVASIAAGRLADSPVGKVSGVAPQAWIGVYKVFPERDGGAPDPIIIRAVEDAVKDGMDVINLSLGSVFAADLVADPVVKAVERAIELGVMVTIAAGNEGPGLNTVSSPGTAPAAITVGSSSSDRAFSSSLALATGLTVRIIPGSRSSGAEAITGDLISIKPWDFSELACTQMPPGAFKGRIVLVMRGECFFEIKLQKLAEAGALAAIVYTDSARPDAIVMSVGDAGLPAAMVSYADGVALKAVLDNGPVKATLTFQPVAIPADPNRVSSFSGRGPSITLAIKPELLATGSPVVAAALKGTWESSGGTSLSAPVLAGAAALLKSGRPGLSPAQYKSLLVNSARKLTLADGKAAPVQHTGAGLLDMDAALQGTATLFPDTLSFGVVSSGGSFLRQLTMTQIGPTATTYSVVAEPMPGQNAEAPEVSPSNFTLQRGASSTLNVFWANPPWRNQSGWLRIRPAAGGPDLRVPYWMSLGAGQTDDIVLLDIPVEGAADYLDWLLFRPVDADGVATPQIYPYVEVLAGGGRVLRVEPINYLTPGAFAALVRYGPNSGENVFSIRSGKARRDVTIRVP